MRSVIGATCLALLAGSLAAAGSVATAGPAQAAAIPTNPCAAPEGSAPPVVTTRPVLTKVRVSPTVVDVRRRAADVEVTLKVSDTVAVSEVHVAVRRIGRTTGLDATGYARLVGGTATAGTWRASLQLDRGIRDGRYRVLSVSLRDVGGATARYTPGNATSVSWPAPFVVRSRTDRTAPTVSDFRVSTRSVDTRTSAKTVAIRVTTRDDISGVALVRVRGRGIDSMLQPAESANHGFDIRLTRSTTRKHRWVGTVVIPTWAGISSWKLSVNVRDRREHLRHISTSGLARRGWQSTLKVTSLRDPVDPTLAALSFSPASVDARAGAVRVDVSYRVTDALSGPSTTKALEFWPSIGTLVVTSVSGPATDRTYEGYIVVPQCGFAAQSTWSMQVELRDNAGNARWYTTEEIAALGFTSELSVQQRDARGPYLQGGYVDAGGHLRVDFSEPVLMTAPLASLLRVAVNGVTTGGTWVCRHAAGDVVACDADGADVVTATFTPSAAFVTGDGVFVWPTSSPPSRIGIYDLDGAPMTRAPFPLAVTA